MQQTVDFVFINRFWQLFYRFTKSQEGNAKTAQQLIFGIKNNVHM